MISWVILIPFNWGNDELICSSTREPRPPYNQCFLCLVFLSFHEGGTQNGFKFLSRMGNTVVEIARRGDIWNCPGFFSSPPLFTALFLKDGRLSFANTQDDLRGTELWHITLNSYWEKYSLFSNLSMMIFLRESIRFMLVFFTLFSSLLKLLFNKKRRVDLPGA